MSLLEFTTFEDEDWEPPVYDRTVKERVLFQVDGDEVFVLSVEAEDGSACVGMVSHEQDYGCLDYMLEQYLRDNPLRGYYVAEGCEMSYHTDYWGEHDADLYLDDLRPATIPEIEEAGELAFISTVFRQAWLALLDLWGVPL